MKISQLESMIRKIVKSEINEMTEILVEALDATITKILENNRSSVSEQRLDEDFQYDAQIEHAPSKKSIKNKKLFNSNSFASILNSTDPLDAYSDEAVEDDYASAMQRLKSKAVQVPGIEHSQLSRQSSYNGNGAAVPKRLQEQKIDSNFNDMPDVIKNAIKRSKSVAELAEKKSKMKRGN